MASDPPTKSKIQEGDQAEASRSVAPYREDLIACFRRLKNTAQSRGIRVDAFCRALLAGEEGQHTGAGNEVAFLTALLETFRVETRNGRNYLLLLPPTKTKQPNAATCVKRSRDTKRFRKRGVSRRLSSNRLTAHSDVAVRVTECSREERFIKINFHLKKDGEKVCALTNQLSRMDLGLPVKSYRGLRCVAPYGEEMNDGDLNENYARAVVLKPARKTDRYVKVKFFDFGFVDYVEKTSLRKLPAVFRKIPALSHTAIVVNTCLPDPSERENQAFTMMESEQTIVRVLRHNKERKFYEVYVFRPNRESGVGELGFQ